MAVPGGEVGENFQAEVGEGFHEAALGSRGVDFANLLIVHVVTSFTIFPGNDDIEGDCAGEGPCLQAPARQPLAHTGSQNNQRARDCCALTPSTDGEVFREGEEAASTPTRTSESAVGWIYC